jgi:hypothetical protein
MESVKHTISNIMGKDKDDTTSSTHGTHGTHGTHDVRLSFLAVLRRNVTDSCTGFVNFDWNWSNFRWIDCDRRLRPWCDFNRLEIHWIDWRRNIRTRRV